MTTLNLEYQPNAAYFGDCKDIMEAWKEKGVQGIIDLIYLDPPFNSNRNYGTPTAKSKKNDSGSAIAFTDMWTYDATTVERLDRIISESYRYGETSKLIAGLKPYLRDNDPGMLAYISYMAERLHLMHGFLKESGSIYLHCDPSANYYLRLLMDSIFGSKNFRNEIVWKRTVSNQKGSQHPPKTWGNNTDTILFYAKSDKHKPKPFRPLTEAEIEEKFNKTDEKGRKYQVQPGAIFRPLSMGERPNLCYEWKGFYPPHPSGWRLSKKRLEEEHQKGNIVIREDGKLERRQFLEDYPGIKPGNLWHDILPVLGNESQGYPTEKPVPLLDRIIQASSNEGDVVFDPFGGCGTTMHAALELKRKAVISDISVFCIEEVTQKRIKREMGRDIPTFGIPVNFEGAKLLAQTDKKKFEVWASQAMTPGGFGILPKVGKGADGGVDGEGWLYGETDHKEDAVIVEVKSGGFTIDDVRAFARIIEREQAAAGIFITLDGNNRKGKTGTRWSKGMEKEALDFGFFKMADGSGPYPRLQHWAVRDRWAKGEDPRADGVYPKMPIMINPHNHEPIVDVGTTISSKPVLKSAPRNRRRKNKYQTDFI